MTKRLNSKHKVDRRLKANLWGRPKSPFNKRDYGPGQHGQGRKGKPSDYGTQLQAKQKLKAYYGNINERQFRNIYKKAVMLKGDTGENLIGLLERRLDAVIYRAKFATTVFSSRQLINHGHVRVNGKKSTVFKPENHATILGSIEKINLFFHSSVIMRRNFIESLGGYDTKCLRAQDYDLWLRGVDKFKYHNLQEVLMTYSSRNQSFKSIYYGLRVRVINAYRRNRIIIGSLKAAFVFMYGLWIKAIGSIK